MKCRSQRQFMKTVLIICKKRYKIYDEYQLIKLYTKYCRALKVRKYVIFSLKFTVMQQYLINLLFSRSRHTHIHICCVPDWKNCIEFKIACKILQKCLKIYLTRKLCTASQKKITRLAFCMRFPLSCGHALAKACASTWFSKKSGKS